MGWFCLSESSWEVYRLSKMFCLMSQVRFSLQDSLRFLVQDSLVGLGRLVLDACHSVLSLPEDLAWGSDLINSPYKCVSLSPAITPSVSLCPCHQLLEKGLVYCLSYACFYLTVG